MFRLIPCSVQHLSEISLPVKQSHSGKGQFQIACGLQMVACEDTQTAGKDGNTFVDTELKGKISDGAVLKIILCGDLPFKFIVDSVKLAQIGMIFGKFLQPVLGDPPEKRFGIA